MSTSTTVTPITITGNWFYQGTTRWAPKGLCYQPVDNVDPISDDNYDTISALVSSSGNFTKLGINALRVYQVNPAKSHKRVMDLLASKGIYVLIGTVNSDTALPRNGDYTALALYRSLAVVRAFKDFDNVLGFSVSNELLDAAGQQTTAAAMKSLARDTKAYISSLVTSGKMSRNIPVGAALRDNRSYTWPATKFYTCGAESDRLDFIAYNIYVWCPGANPTNYTGQIDAYHKLYEHFKNFPVPVFWGEHGCGTSGVNREWKQIPYLYGNKDIYPASTPSQTVNMANVIQGGFAFRYIEHNQNLGLMEKDATTPRTNGGFADLCTEYATVSTFGGTTPGTANSGNKEDCSTWADPSFDPSMVTPAMPISGMMVSLTNQVTPATKMQLLAYLPIQGQAAKYHPIAFMESGDPAMQVLIPTGTSKLMMVYDSSAAQWPMGCQVTDMSSITAGCTIEGNWVVPNGNGTCVITPS